MINKIHEETISNNVPFNKAKYETLRKIAFKQHKTLRKAIQTAVNEYIDRNIKELERDEIMIG
jgi:hypothetical protein